MNFFLVLKGKTLKQALFIFIAVIFAVGVLVVEREQVTVFSQEEPSAIYSVKTDKKWIALTFDISWGDKRPGPILDILDEKGIDKATFFLSSPWSQNEPEIVDRIVDAGFEIGSHGHKHDNYSQYSEEQIRKQISTAHRILSEETQSTPNLIRMPNGDFDERVLRIANDLNYTVVQWDTDSRDWMNPGVDKIVDRVVSKAHKGDIVLMHASDSCKETHLALPIIIDQLREQGYKFVTVTELMNHAEIEKSEVKDMLPQN